MTNNTDIQISWLLKKPTDLEQHCLQRYGISWTRVNIEHTGSGNDSDFFFFFFFFSNFNPGPAELQYALHLQTVKIQISWLHEEAN